MPGLHRDSRRHGGNKKRVLIDGTGYEPDPASKPRAFQQPTVSPAPFVARTKPEAPATPDLPLWPGWHDDPTGRHESRYFDGTSWTDNVVDGAKPSNDPFEPRVDETPYGEFVPPCQEVAHHAVTAGDLLFGTARLEG
jgi:Protein of unknown function (DUF2510)